MIFEPIELITFGVILVSFVLFLRTYLKNKESNKEIWNCLFVIGVFILLNRIFTNIEVLAYGDLFNLLEHLSMLLASVVFVYFSWMLNRSLGKEAGK